MAASFFFYDLETSGINPREARIMQFAGQRTDIELKPIGEPINLLIKLTPDVVPEPDAIMITGITPQATQADGINEAEFLQIFYKNVVVPGTVFMGFNSVRFDDEFMRYLHYRNFYDPYAWQYGGDCSRWELLDLVRMTRALRPEGIEWPFTPEGKATNRLELLTKLNDLDHEKAHDALNDVLATIAVTKLIRDKQPGLFDYLFQYRGKNDVKQKIEEFSKANQPFLYTSGRYPSEFLHTTAVYLLGEHAKLPNGYVYDLRHDPDIFQNMSADELLECAKFSRDPEHIKLPVKTLKFNKCPAIAPMGILSNAPVQERLHLTVDQVQANLHKLKTSPGLITRLIEAQERVESDRTTYYSQADKLGDPQFVDGQLYEGFVPNQDKQAMETIQKTSPDDFATLDPSFKDKRLQALFPLYKARNYPKLLLPDERQAWDEFCKQHLLNGAQNSRLAKFFKRIDEIAQNDNLTENQRFALEELHLYGESIMPTIEDGVAPE
jgi:exodeoxyribonuclease-1